MDTVVSIEFEDGVKDMLGERMEVGFLCHISYLCIAQS